MNYICFFIIDFELMSVLAQNIDSYDVRLKLTGRVSSMRGMFFAFKGRLKCAKNKSNMYSNMNSKM